MGKKYGKKRKPKKRHEPREKFKELIESKSPPEGIEWDGPWSGLEWARNHLREAAEFCGNVHGSIIRFIAEVNANGVFDTKPRAAKPPPEIRESRRILEKVMEAMISGPVPLPDYDPGETVKLHVVAQSNYLREPIPFAESMLTDQEAMSPFEWVGAGTALHFAKVRSQVSGREGELPRVYLRRVRSAASESA